MCSFRRFLPPTIKRTYDIEEYDSRKRRNLSDLNALRRKAFEELIAGAIRASLTGLIGQNAVESMNSYLEPIIAVKNTKNYEAWLRSIFGKATDLVLKQIENEICERVSIEKRQWSTFDQCLTAAKAQGTIPTN